LNQLLTKGYLAMSFTLINAGPSPFGRKVAIALIEKRLDYVVQYDLPWGDNTCTPQYSPMEQLPILIDESGHCVYDSNYILEWLERRFPKPALLPSGVDAILEAKLRQLLGERLLDFMGSLAFEIIRPAPSQAWVERQKRKVIGVLGELDRKVDGRFIRDAEPIDLGDIAVGAGLLVLESSVKLGHLPELDIFKWRGRYQNLTAYMKWLEERPSFVATPYKTMEVDLAATVA